MTTEIAFDKKKNSQLFDDVAIIFERYNLKTEPYLKGGFDSLLSIERDLQDLEDEASLEDHEEYFLLGIHSTINFLKFWRKIFNNSVHERSVLNRFVKFLNTLVNILPTVKRKRYPYAELEDLFIQLYQTIQDIIERYDPLFEVENLFSSKFNENLSAKYATAEEISTWNMVGEKQVYEFSAYLWINSVDAYKANSFMHLISSALTYIDDVEIEIVETGLGSFFQNWIIKFKNLFAKKRTKEILDKSIRAAEYYSLDRHIEPIEKSRIERKKSEEEIKRMMSEEQVRELNNLIIEEKKEDLKSKKLSNIEKEIELRLKISDLIAKGLIDIDDDFKIMINQVMLIEQKNKVIQIGDIEKVDEDK